MKIALLGFGLIGRKRAAAISSLHIQGLQVDVFDPVQQGRHHDHPGFTLHEDVETFKDMFFDAAILCLPHDLTIEHLTFALTNTKKILVEKPLGRNLPEFELLRRFPNLEKISVGFNYRFMPGVIRLKELVESDHFGEIVSIKMDLGHGGSPEDKDSWKLDPSRAGGGVVLDPGIHLYDLLHHIFGITAQNLHLSSVDTWSGFWKTGIEEHININASWGRTLVAANVSIVSWRTRFRVEIIGTDGYAVLEGRGRTDGPQILRSGRRWGWKSGKSQFESEIELVHETRDNSFEFETKSWLEGDPRVAKMNDSLVTMQLVDLIRSKAKLGHTL